MTINEPVFTSINFDGIKEYFRSLGLDILLDENKGDKPHDVDEWQSVKAWKPFLKDLHRLHSLVVENKRTTVLEFGVGWSSLVLAHALHVNGKRYKKDIKQLRRKNPFELHSVDNYQKWIDVSAKRLLEHKLENFTCHYSSCHVYDFKGIMTSRYDSLPNINPDFIYLDGPDQYNILGSLNGLGFSNSDFMPMASDILLFEHFLTPGTIIVVDGRTANARFLKANFQRNWRHKYEVEYDQHIFWLDEEPLGVYNKAQLEFYGN